MKAKGSYIIYLNDSGEFLESTDMFRDNPFGTTDINCAQDFEDYDSAKDFSENNLADAIVLKRM